MNKNGSKTSKQMKEWKSKNSNKRNELKLNFVKQLIKIRNRKMLALFQLYNKKNIQYENIFFQNN